MLFVTKGLLSIHYVCKCSFAEIHLVDLALMKLKWNTTQKWTDELSLVGFKFFFNCKDNTSGRCFNSYATGVLFQPMGRSTLTMQTVIKKLTRIQ